MQKNDPFHYLVKAIYKPRVVAYGFSALVSFSQVSDWGNLSGLAFAFMVICLVYPHCAFWVCGIYFNSAVGARYSLLIDAVLVGCLIILNGFYLFASVSFIVALTLSTLIIAKPGYMVLNGVILCSVVVSGLLMGAPLQQDGSIATDILCSFSLVSYACIVAFLGFKATENLGTSRQQARQSNLRLDGMNGYLKRYISPQIYSTISSTHEEELKTRRKRLTVFFSDIEGFTELMDNLEEEAVTVILNEYLNTMAEIALEFGGTLDKFIGDGIMVFFGDPETLGARQDALRCARMALEMRRRLGSLRNKWRQAGIFSDLHIRVGIHTGYCAVGNFGSEHRMDYTAVGSTVNIASRLEGKAERDTILLSDSTYRLIADSLVCQARPAVNVKGISQAIENYELIGERVETQMAIIEYDISGLQLSLNPSLIDVARVRSVLEEIDDSIAAFEHKKTTASPKVRLIG